MPLLTFHVGHQGSADQIRALLDVAHSAVVDAFEVLPAAGRADRAGVPVKPADLIVSITENGDADWSFGHGRAQFLTGELR